MYPPDGLRQVGLGRRLTPQQVPRQEGVRKRQQLGEYPALGLGCLWQHLLRKALEQHIELLHAPAAAPAQEPDRGRRCRR